MVNKKSFINPLTRSSEEKLHIPESPQVASTDTSTYTENQQQLPVLHEFQPVRKRGYHSFEKTHDRFSGWIDKNLKQQFFDLADNKGVSKTSLLNEAIADLLRKYMQK